MVTNMHLTADKFEQYSVERTSGHWSFGAYVQVAPLSVCYFIKKWADFNLSATHNVLKIFEGYEGLPEQRGPEGAP